MYWLMKVSRSTLNNVPSRSFLSPENCFFCHHVPQVYATQSSTIEISQTKSKKLRSFKKRKCLEILEVKEDHANEKNALVKRVTSKNISSVKLLGGHEEEKEMWSGRRLPAYDCLAYSSSSGPFEEGAKEASDFPEELEEIQEEGLCERLENLPSRTENAQSQHTPPTSSNLNNKRKKGSTLSKENRERTAKVKYLELDTAGKEKSLNDCLASYLELCSSCGLLNRGWSTLMYYIQHKNTVKITQVKVLNALMYGFAKHGNADKMLELWELMKTLSIKPSVLSFALRVEAIARCTKKDKVEMMECTLRAMEEESVALSDLFAKCKWKGDSREVVFGMIRAVRPSFVPFVAPPDLHYTSPLLAALNQHPQGENRLRSPAEGLINEEEMMNLFREQASNEFKSYINVKSIEEPPTITPTIEHCRKKLDSLKETWEQAIMNALYRDISAMNNLHNNLMRASKQLNIYPYLVILEKHQYRDVILHEIRRLAEGSETYSPSASQLYRDLGHQVKLRYDIKVKKNDGVLKKIDKLYCCYSKWYLAPSEELSNPRQKWQTLKYKYFKGPTVDLESHSWPPNVLTAIGRFLYNIILRDIKIDINSLRSNTKDVHYLPAFYSIYRQQGQLTKEEIKPHPVLSKLFRAAALQHLTFNVSELPMVCPPIPWSTLHSGGYVVSKTNLIRLPHQAIQQWERLKETPPNQIYPCLDSLNQLGSIPWRVNTQVLDIIVKLFNSGGFPKLDIPESPSAFSPSDSLSELSSETPATKEGEAFHNFRLRMILKRKKAEMYSLWCDALYRLSLANHFRDRIFWLPHNMDFRGRVYPCPPHLNHLGSDMARSLLCFAKGLPLGPSGLDWLKIHLVNLTGLKKRDSISDRLKFANDSLEEILDSASRPLDGRKWWMESDEPWQTLACCIEIKNALDEAGGPQSFVSHFPIHQDGSCNGLQHYAALGRDTAGASSVNLSPAQLPQDVYSCVAAIVERERAADARAGLKVAQVLDGFVRRKVIKQTVMTTVYGVTRFGARLQIAKQLKDIDEFPKDFVWPASTYLVTKTFASLREMFTSTREIQDWFTESARMISQVCGQNVEYVTPLGLPVVQPYYKFTKVADKKLLNAGNIQEHHYMDMFERPNVMKQKNAFPPNFIHSLDSTHMMLTSLHCEREGITFVSVHDCYWTHPCHVHIMNKICREQFVALHSQPILQDLSQFLMSKFGYSNVRLEGDTEAAVAAKKKLNTLLTTLPKRGDFQLENVLDSLYFFS